MIHPPPTIKLSVVQIGVYSALAYFDVFNYPISEKEIRAFLPSTAPINGTLISELNALVHNQVIYKLADYYSLQNDDRLVSKRVAGNKLAIEYLKKAKLISKFIGQFPFVRGVFISGSLSKGYMGEDADIDYFIVTKPGRLWLARTLLILFKKVFLLNSRKYFCVNYFVDENHLEIEDKNMFTAVELSTIIPTFNKQMFTEIKRANTWTKQYLPNHPWSDFKKTPKESPNLLKRILEFILSGALGSYLNKKALRKTLSFWKNKFSDFDQVEFEHALKSRSYVSKHHPQNFQKKVLNAYQQKIALVQ